MNNINLEKCILKFMQQDKQSTTFKQLNKGHNLYDCTLCLGYTNVCENYKPLKKYKNSLIFNKIITKFNYK